jgi:hypothetical protein
MHKTPTAEWLLARVTTPDRAAAILGDLAELSATRGRVWFWAAYTRTVITLGWRAPLAFIVAYAFSTWVAVGGFPTMRSVFRTFNRIVQHTAPHQAIWHVFDRAAHHQTPQTIWHVPIGDSLIALWFILPFLLVRFGFRDRLTQLASAIFLLTIPFFSLSPAGMNFAAFATATTILAALCLSAWRRPMIVLAASVGPIAIAIFFSAKVWFLFLARGYGFNSPQLQWAMALYRAVELCIAAIVCSYLYSRLLPRKSTDLSTIA